MVNRVMNGGESEIIMQRVEKKLKKVEEKKQVINIRKKQIIENKRKKCLEINENNERNW